jgi:hypothetical protein
MKISQNLIKELGIENLPSEQQSEIVMETGRIIYQNIITRVLETLSKDEADEFEKFLGKNMEDQDKIYEFLKTKIPNIDEIVNEEIIKFKSGAISVMKAASGE